MQQHHPDTACHLTRCEMAYVVAALKITLDHHDSRLLARDREIMTALMQRLATGLDLDEEVRRALQT